MSTIIDCLGLGLYVATTFGTISACAGAQSEPVVREIPVRPTANCEWAPLAQLTTTVSPSIRSLPNRESTRSSSDGLTLDQDVPSFIHEDGRRNWQILFVNN